MTPWYGRPRILYSSVFTWVSMTGGRFLAPFLEHRLQWAPGQIGVALALHQVVSTLTGSAGGAGADHLERRYPHIGRAIVLGVGVATGTMALCLQEVHVWFPQTSFWSTTWTWFVLLRCVYAASSSLVFPVLDGMTLSFLGKQSEDYGKERLYGAVTWAAAHLVLALSLDGYGFVVTYPWSLVSTAAAYLTLLVYVSEERAHRRSQYTKSKSEVTQGSTDLRDDNTRPKVSFWTLIRLLAGTPYSLYFLWAVLCISMGQVVVDSLIFLYFEVLHSSYAIMGLTVLLTVAFEIPIFHIAPQLLKHWGSGRMVLLAAACYAVRVVAYSCIPVGHVLYALVLEPLHGITYGCMQTAVVDFAAKSVPAGYEASGQGLVSVVRGVGSVVGLLWGGWATEHIGPRLMYRISAGVALMGNILLAWHIRASGDCPTTSSSSASVGHGSTIPSDESDEEVVELVERYTRPSPREHDRQ